jgi:hypothetical protein
MRLVTSAKYLIGFAAASGVVVVLGGSALAAEGVAKPDVQSPNIAFFQPVDSASQSEVHQNKDTESTPVLLSEESSESGTAVNKPQVEASKESAPQAIPVVKGAEVSSSVKSGITQTIQKSTSLVPVVPVAQSKTPDAPVGDQPTQPQLEQVTSAPKEPVVSAQVSNMAADRVVVFKSQVLPLQPLITSHASLVNSDLAATVPSAPATKDMPAPANSTGLLSSLTASLASTIVPQFMIMQVSEPSPIVASLRLTTGLVVFVFIYSFGLWIRRGGFQFAARSDVAASGFFVATPLSMGYVPASPQIHSPFLVVSETKTFSLMFPNALRKEEMI